MRVNLLLWEERNGFKGSFVAQKIGVSSTTWSLIKNDRQNPTFKQLMTFKDVFGQDLDMDVLDLFKSFDADTKF